MRPAVRTIGYINTRETDDVALPGESVMQKMEAGQLWSAEQEDFTKTRERSGPSQVSQT